MLQWRVLEIFQVTSMSMEPMQGTTEGYSIEGYCGILRDIVGYSSLKGF